MSGDHDPGIMPGIMGVLSMSATVDVGCPAIDMLSTTFTVKTVQRTLLKRLPLSCNGEINSDTFILTSSAISAAESNLNASSTEEIHESKWSC